MSHAYTEDQLVEQPAIGLFAALGWQTISALEETFGTAGTLGRETKSEVVLVERLRIALTKLGDSPHVFKTVSDYLITRKTRGLSPRFWSMRNGIASSG